MRGQELYDSWGRGEGSREQKNAWNEWESTKIPYKSSIGNYCKAKTDLETAESNFPDNVELQNLCYRAFREAEANWRTEAARVEGAWNNLERLERLASEVGPSAT